jgi:hypothetical protein
MSLNLLDDSLKVEIFFEPSDRDFEDNICVCITETCPDEEKIFIHDETNVYLTTAQAEEFARLLLQAAASSRQGRTEEAS